jgi:hypothetical protein
LAKLSNGVSALQLLTEKGRGAGKISLLR